MVLVWNAITVHRVVYTLRIVICVWTATAKAVLPMKAVRNVHLTLYLILRLVYVNATRPIDHLMTSSALIVIQPAHYA